MDHRDQWELGGKVRVTKTEWYRERKSREREIRKTFFGKGWSEFEIGPGYPIFAKKDRKKVKIGYVDIINTYFKWDRMKSVH
jgi:hypothetical protein